MRINLTLIIQMLNIVIAVGLVRRFLVIPIIAKLRQCDEKESLLKQEISFVSNKARAVADKTSKELVDFRLKMESICQSPDKNDKCDETVAPVTPVKTDLDGWGDSQISYKAEQCAERLLHDLFGSK